MKYDKKNVAYKFLHSAYPQGYDLFNLTYTFSKRVY
jgi:hypothetical protein